MLNWNWNRGCVLSCINQSISSAKLLEYNCTTLRIITMMQMMKRDHKEMEKEEKYCWFLTHFEMRWNYDCLLMHGWKQKRRKTEVAAGCWISYLIFWRTSNNFDLIKVERVNHSIIIWRILEDFDDLMKMLKIYLQSLF